MDKHAASCMIAKLLECQRTLDSALETAEGLSDENERAAVVSTLKNVIGEILIEAIMPIVSQHPELNPYD